jgi:hypothetical protein
LALAGDQLTIHVGEGEGKRATLAMNRIEGLGAAIVGGLGPRPVLVIDLLLNWRNADAEELQHVRFRSNRFDPRSLYPEAGGPIESIRSLLSEILERSGAEPLPSRPQLMEGSFARFDDLAAYECDVLKIDRLC